MILRWTNSDDGNDVLNQIISLFIENVGTEYITHIEVEEGRAISSEEWDPNLRNILYTQFWYKMKDGDILQWTTTK